MDKNIKLINFRKHFLIIQTLFISILFIIVYAFNNKESTTLFLILSVWNIVSYIILFIKELTLSKDFHPFIVLALISVQYLGLSAFQMWQLLIDKEPILFGIYTLNSYILEGLLFLSLQHLLILLGYYIINNKNNNNYISIYDNVMTHYENYYLYAIIVYLFVWGFRLTQRLVDLADISSILVNFSKIGYVISLLLLQFSIIKKRTQKKIYIYWIITVIEIVYVLNKGMKEAIITPLLPYILSLFIQYKAGKIKLFKYSTILKFSVLFLFIIGFVFPYISIFRSTANDKQTEWKNISVSEVLYQYKDYILKEGRFSQEEEIKGRGLDYFIYRAGEIGGTSFSIKYAEDNGCTPQFFIHQISAAVPRIIWRSKTSLNTGGMAFQLICGDRDFMVISNDYTGTSISFGFIGGVYFSLGLVPALLFSFFSGVIFAYMWNFISTRIHYNFFAIWLFYNIMIVLLKDYESFDDGGIMFYAQAIAFVIIIKIVDKKYIYA